MTREHKKHRQYIGMERETMKRKAIISRLAIGTVVIAAHTICQMSRLLPDGAKHDSDSPILTTSRGPVRFVPVANNDSKTSWTLPVTDFTPTIQNLVDQYERIQSYCSSSDNDYWKNQLRISVRSPTSRVLVEAQNNDNNQHNVVIDWYVAGFKRLFHEGNQRILPVGNISLFISTQDSNNLEKLCAFASSSPGGVYSVFNFQDVQRWGDNKTSPMPLPWNKRRSVPVFRGSLRYNENLIEKLDEERRHNIKAGMNPNEAGRVFFHSIRKPPPELRMHQRLNLVYFSKLRPDLVDARLIRDRLNPTFLWNETAHNGFHIVMPFDEIKEDRYLSEYRTHIVMGGFGAAFRTARLMGQGVAIILQAFPYEEWFVHLMEPWVHYVPLAMDLSNLNDTLHWVKDNQDRVHDIARNGKAFYDKFLSYEAMSEFYHELVFRLMLASPEAEKEASSRYKSIEEDQHTVHITLPLLEEEQVRATNWLLCEALLNTTDTSEQGQGLGQNKGDIIVRTPDCGNAGENVLGNHLSRWYVTRLIAASAGVSLVDDCQGDVAPKILQQVRQDTIVANLGNEHPFSWKPFCKKWCTRAAQDQTACVYPHDDHGGGEWVSPLIYAVPTIRSDLRSMSSEVAHHSNIQGDDVAIHIRIGDIARQNGVLYGLVPYESYVSLIPPDAKSIGIITAPFSQDRSGWGPGDVELNEAVVMATRDYIQKSLPDAEVSIHNKPWEGMDVAYTRLIRAKRAICGPSTFCLFPALACLGESFIFHSPLFGGKRGWLSKVAKTYPDIHYVDKRYIPSTEIYDKNVSQILELLAADNIIVKTNVSEILGMMRPEAESKRQLCEALRKKMGLTSYRCQ